MKCTALLHHMTIDLLRESFYATRLFGRNHRRQIRHGHFRTSGMPPAHRHPQGSTSGELRWINLPERRRFGIVHRHLPNYGQ
ncbi:MAG: hypothetical protein JOZ36_05720 [Acidobacteria bacterium]|nr:hypothetical protein [Acidobacteriota bacterium]